MKRKVKYIVDASIAALFCLPLAVGCNGKAPWEYANVDWYSENPVIQLHTEYSGEPSNGYMEADGRCIAICLWWGPPTYNFSIYALGSDGTTADAGDLLLSGKVTYNVNVVTLIVEKDNIFGYSIKSIELKMSH